MEYAPRYCSGHITILMTFTPKILGMICERVVFRQPLHQRLHQAWRTEELDIGFLKYKAGTWTPAMGTITRRDTIDSRLAVDGEESILVQEYQLVVDRCTFRFKTSIVPRKAFDLAGQELEENIRNVSKCGRMFTPHRTTIELFTHMQEEQMVVVQLTESRRFGITPATVREFTPLLGTMNVALRSMCPKDRSNVLILASRVQAGAIGEHFVFFRFLWCPAKRGDNLGSSNFQVDCVKVNALRGSCVQKSATLLYRELNTILTHCLIIVLQRCDGIAQTGRDTDSRIELTHARERTPRLNRKNARDDRTCDTDLSAVLHPLDVAISVEEQLADDKVCTGIDLLLEMLQLLFVGTFPETFWIAGNRDAKVVTILLTNQLHQLVGVREATWCLGEPVVTLWWITTQCQNVANAALLDLGENAQQLATSESGHAQMQLCLQTADGLRSNGNVQTELLSACPPGQVDKVRLELGAHVIKAFQEIEDTSLRACREVLKAKVGLIGILLRFEHVDDLLSTLNVHDDFAVRWPTLYCSRCVRHYIYALSTMMNPWYVTFGG
mmetsp:Transcript_2790/g.6792  ORF Transcript_2790/g.6792 Transcript_2790/m.6792 type:complete len:554 (-) Transcript_2790:70-1731(-)